VVSVTTDVPGLDFAGGRVEISGVVTRVESRHDGARFQGDVFLAARDVLPLELARSARVRTTRVSPEVGVPPNPGEVVRRADDAERAAALHLDEVEPEDRVPVGIGRDGREVLADLSFIDGRRGAHLNISGISGVATKTSYALFLLYAVFQNPAVAARRPRAVVFNVKGEDLLWLDHPNGRLPEEDRAVYRRLGLAPGTFPARIHAPVRARTELSPDTSGRREGVVAYLWTVRDFCRDRLLRFLFGEEGEDARSLMSYLVTRVEARLAREARDCDPSGRPAEPGVVWLERWDPGQEALVPQRVDDFDLLVDVIRSRLEHDGDEWRAGMAPGTVGSFLRRLDAAAAHCGHLVRGAGLTRAEIDRHSVRLLRTDAAGGDEVLQRAADQVVVVDIHRLHDIAQRFVVGAVIRTLFQQKADLGEREPLVFLMLDELNKYAPRQGWSPIKEVLLDIAERGRSLGLILVGAQQTASEVERRVVANCSVRVVGRLDAAEVERPEYGYMDPTARQRAILLRPGSMLVLQPRVPVPLEVTFPFPSWATRKEETRGTDVEAEARRRALEEALPPDPD
jgi:hypothetical protein